DRRADSGHGLSSLAGAHLLLGQAEDAAPAETDGLVLLHPKEERLFGVEALRGMLERALQRVLLVPSGQEDSEHLVHRAEETRVVASGLRRRRHVRSLLDRHAWVQVRNRRIRNWNQRKLLLLRVPEGN